MIERLAASLREAERTRSAIDPIAKALSDPSVANAYRVQRTNTDLRVQAGHRVVGRKIGLTSAAVQRQLGVDQPDFGVLFDDMEVADGGSIDLGALIEPRIEAEIAFVLERDLDLRKPSLRDVIAAVGYAVPCLEIVDCRIAKWAISIFDTIADNGAAARFVAGTQVRKLHDFDAIGCGMVMRANGQVIATGSGAASLGNPLEALRWLAAKAVEIELPLRAGEIVLSGALGPMVPVRAGVHYVASIQGLGEVRVNFTGSPP
jgi:2-keto-4-pentenoate hydratase